jgi:hypothetical protein
MRKNSYYLSKKRLSGNKYSKRLSGNKNVKRLSGNKYFFVFLMTEINLVHSTFYLIIKLLRSVW